MGDVYKTRAIVLRNIKYGESGKISTFYTESFGLRSYIIRGTHSPRAKIKSAHIQPLSQIEIVGAKSKKGDLHHIRELQMLTHYKQFHNDMKKGAILMFINEVLNLSLKEENGDSALFNFISQQLIQLDQQTEDVANFHLFFMASFTSFLGFAPHLIDKESLEYFDLMGGIQQKNAPSHQYFLDGKLFQNFRKIFNNSHVELENRNMRNNLLDGLIEYYCLHLPNFHEPKSLAVLRTLF